MPTFAKRAAPCVAVSMSVLLSALVLLSGCAGVTSSTNPPAPVPSVSVSVSPAASSVQAGQTQKFTATVTNDSQNKGVTWALSGAGCSGSTCGTLSATSTASGAAVTYTAPASVPSPATVTLTAASVSDGTKSAAATITVTAPPAAIVVTVSPTSFSVPTGGSQNFTATVQNDSQNKGVTWALLGASCSEGACGTLSSTPSASVYTAPATLPSPATITLKATSVADGSKSADATITVTSAAPAIVVSVSPPSPVSIETSASKTFTATVQNDAQNKGVSWKLSGTGCTGVTCGTLLETSSASGVPITYIAPAALPSPTTVTLTATSFADSTKSAAATIIVTSTISVTVSPLAASPQVGQTQKFTATVTNDGQSKGVTWVLSGMGCSGPACGALSATSSGSGSPITYTAPANVPTPPAVTLTATSVSDGTKSAAAAITVTPASGVIVVTVLPPTSVTVLLNGTHNFTATVQNDPQNKGVTWMLIGASCGESSCGTLSATTSASGIAITYTAPAIAPNPPNSTTIILRAISVTDASKFADAQVTIM